MVKCLNGLSLLQFGDERRGAIKREVKSEAVYNTGDGH